jgi:Amt family ammonium transporter
MFFVWEVVFMEATSALDTGDTAWMLMSTALVLLMTPGLAFFYAGMVRAKNVVSTLFQNLICVGVVGVLWLVCGYSLAFSGNTGGFIGDLGNIMMINVSQEPNPALAGTIPELVFALFQGMFAVITPALITGAFAERMRFFPWVVITALWSLLVYVPVAHWVWGAGGIIKEWGALDFAGGMVVHMTAGFSALVFGIMERQTPTQEEASRPYDLGLVLLGTALLFFGWFGFNGGSALGANGLAAHASTTTFAAAAAAMLSWTFVDYLMRGKTTIMGACVGLVAGLVAITPAAGFVTVGVALLMGAATGIICNMVILFIRTRTKLKDTLDVFGCHGVAGLLGTLLTALFATKSVNAAGADGLFYGSAALLVPHIMGSLLVIGYSVVMTFIIIKVMRIFTPLTIDHAAAEAGIDTHLHGEQVSSVLSMGQTGSTAKG